MGHQVRTHDRSERGRRGDDVPRVSQEDLSVESGSQEMNATRVILYCALLGAGTVFAQQVEIVPVRGNIYLLAGAGGNITASVGPDGVLLVDSGLAQMSDKVLAAIRQLG